MLEGQVHKHHIAHFEMRGITMVAPQKPIGIDPLHEIKHLNSNWVALVPYAFQRNEDCAVHYNEKGRWWGENIEGIVSSILLAKDAGLKVMLKPQIYIHGKWTGDIDCRTNTDWGKWEKEYTDYTLKFAKIAQENGVEMLCFGTELKNPIKERPAYFLNLIKQIRAVYKGQLTYAANWDDYEKVPFWKELDYIGINAYWPLSSTLTPGVPELNAKWKPFVRDMEKFTQKHGKKVVFTEFGYLSVDRSAWKSWEVQYKLEKQALNEQAQANAFESLFASLSEKKWWSGGFIWKWYPANMGHEGQMPKDFTPQGKIAQTVIEKWFCR